LERLKESEARFRAIADDAPVMIWMADENGASVYQSRLWLQTTGQTSAQARGFGWVDAIHTDDRQAEWIKTLDEVYIWGHSEGGKRKSRKALATCRGR
jgi:PAS domain S-box-containing protein